MTRIKFLHQCDAPSSAPGVEVGGKVIKPKPRRYPEGAIEDASQIDQAWLEGAIREEFVEVLPDEPEAPAPTNEKSTAGTGTAEQTDGDSAPAVADPDAPVPAEADQE